MSNDRIKLLHEVLAERVAIIGGPYGTFIHGQNLTADDYGRDHHPRCFSTWMAGGGVRGGSVYGETCEFGYNILSDGVPVHDLQATMMHLLGIDHERLTYKFQGRRYRLTDIHGQVVKGLVS